MANTVVRQWGTSEHEWGPQELNVRDIQLLEFGEQVSVGLPRLLLRHANVVEASLGHELDSNALGVIVVYRDQGADGLEGEAGSVDDRSTVRVGTLVGSGVEELLREVSGGAVELERRR